MNDGRPFIYPSLKPAAKPEQSEKLATKYDYGNTQANIPAESEAAKALKTAREKIDKSDLIATKHGGNEKGLETEPHVTLRYGIKGDDTAGIRAYLEQQAPFEASLGKTESFAPSKSSDGGAPIIAPVKAPELHRIERELDQHGDFIDRTFPEYKPHATLAYAKPEAARKYVGMADTDGKKFTVKTISISKRDGTAEEVTLKGKPAAKPTPQVDTGTSASATGPFGPIHREFYHDAKGAIERLLADKNGEAIAALHHPEVRDIDLVYGKEGSHEKDYRDGYGIAKIAIKHPEVLKDLQGFVERLPVKSKSANRIVLSDGEGRAIVRLEWDGKQKNWLLTAYTREENLSAAEGGRTGVTNRAEPAPNPAGQEADEATIARNEEPKPQTYKPGQKVTIKNANGTTREGEVRFSNGAGKLVIKGERKAVAAGDVSPAVEGKAEVAARLQAAPIAGTDGKTTTVLTPSRELPAKYRLVDADDLQPSHDAQTFAKNPAYPEGLQERAYDTSKEAQNRVIQQAQNYDPRYTVNTNPDAVNGPPVVTPDGTVLGGNSRTMSTQRLYAKDGSAYKTALKEQSASFGFTPEQVEAMKKPVLVREVEAPASPDDARRIGSELNKSMTGAMGVSERAVSAGKNIKADTLRNVANMMQGDDSTLREAMGRHGSEIVKMLTTDGAITERERPQFVDTATGGLSEEGKTFVERALMGTVIDDPRLMDAAPKSVLAKLERSLGSITSFASRPDEWNLLPAIREAVGELGAIQREGSTIDLRLGQISLFGGERNPLVDAMVRALDGKPTSVRAAFDNFARDADQNMPGQARLFGEANAFDAFNSAFGSKLSEQEYHDGLEEAAAKDPNPAPGANAQGYQGLHGVTEGNQARSREVGTEAGKLDTNQQPAVPAATQQYKPSDKVVVKDPSGALREATIRFANGNGKYVLKGERDPVRPEEIVSRGTLADYRADHFTPGNVIKNDYWNDYDKALSYEPGDKSKPWSVRVIKSDADGNPLPDETPRLHSTEPNAKDVVVKRETQVASEPEESPAEQPKANSLQEHLYDYIDKNGMPKDNNELRKIIAEYDGKPVDQERLKEGQEALETAIADQDKKAGGSVTMSFMGTGALDEAATRALQPAVDYAKKAAATTLDDVVKPLAKTVKGAAREVSLLCGKRERRR